jgi:TPP-dependent pyruvate/acetoin dehydrogenase alpha subunit
MATAERSVEASRELLYRMLLIRRTEEYVIHFAREHQGLVRGNYHVYIGQEASGVGACSALGPDDYVFSTHRNHGHVVARGGEPGPVLAEVIGRLGGYNQGRGGTFHVMAKHLGILQTSAIVGGCVPLAVGAALSIKTRGTDQVSLVFFGDGVLEEGAFHEAINMASLWKLPVVFMCENNSFVQAGDDPRPTRSDSFAATQLVDVAAAMNISTHIVDGDDVLGVSSLLGELVGRTREGEGPFFIESRLTRWPGNYQRHGSLGPDLIGGDFDIRWVWAPQDADPQMQHWIREEDPVSRFARALVDGGEMSQQDVGEIDAAARKEADDGARFALASPAPDPESALGHVYA